MSLPLFYFSATGNTKYAAQLTQKGFNKISKDHTLKLSQIKSISNFCFPKLTKSQNLFGLAFPIHEFMFPRIILKWLEFLPKNEKNIPVYVFIINTSGGISCNSSNIAFDKLKLKGYSPLGVLEIPTPTLEPFFSNKYYPAGWASQILDKCYYFGLVIAKHWVSGQTEFIDQSICYFRFPRLTKWIYNYFSTDQATFGDYVYIQQNLCISCGKCVNTCPTHSISFDNKKVVKNNNKCMSCALCVRSCPVNAINIKYRKNIPKNKNYYSPWSRPGYINPKNYQPRKNPTYCKSLLYLTWLMLKAYYRK